MVRFLPALVLGSLLSSSLPAEEVTWKKWSFPLPEGSKLHVGVEPAKDDRVSFYWTTVGGNDVIFERVLKKATWKECEAYIRKRQKSAKAAAEGDRINTNLVHDVYRIPLKSKVLQGFAYDVSDSSTDTLFATWCYLWDRESVWRIHFAGRPDQKEKALAFIDTIQAAAPHQGPGKPPKE